MSFFSKLGARLNLDISPFIAGLTKATAAANNFAKGTATSFQKMNAAAAMSSRSMSVFTSAASRGLKDVKRIVQGILVSQVIYRTVNQLQELGAAVIQLSMNFEQARVSFSGMFSSIPKADSLLYQLENFAARSPLTFTQTEQATRQLIAYGIQAKNVLTVLKGITDTVAISGRLETLDRLSLAFGQIKGKGRLMGDELRQIAEAGIPVQAILQEELGVKKKDMGNIGRLMIPADEAIAALLTGIEKRYGGAAEAMADTVRGLMSSISDNLLMLGKDLFASGYESIRVATKNISVVLQEWRTIAREWGVGTLLEHIFPGSTSDAIRLFIANLKMFIGNVKLAIGIVKPFAKAIGSFLLTAFNAVAPPINALATILLSLIHAFVKSSNAVRVLVGVLGGLIVAYTAAKLLVGLKVAIMGLWVSRVIAQVVIALAQAIGFLTMMMMTNPWVALFTVAAGALLVVAYNSEKAGAALRKLGSSITSAFGYDPSKVLVPGMTKNTEATDEFGEKIESSADSMKKLGEETKKAGKKAKEALQSFDEVFTINPVDASGAIDNLDNLGDEIFPEIPAASFPMPDFSKVTKSVSEWYDNTKAKILNWCAETAAGFRNWYNNLPVVVWFTASKTGFLDWYNNTKMRFTTWWSESKAGFLDWYNNTKTRFTTWWSESKAGFGQWYNDTKEQLGNWWGETKTGFLDWYTDTTSRFSTWWSESIVGFTDWYSSTKSKLSTWWSETTALFGDWRNLTWEKLGAWWNDTKVGFTTWCSNTKARLTTWWSETVRGFGQWYTDTKLKFTTWWDESIAGFNTWAYTTWTTVSDWWTNTRVGFGTWCSDTRLRFNEWWYNSKEGFNTWAYQTKTTMVNWAKDTYNGVLGWWDKLMDKLQKFWDKLTFWDNKSITVYSGVVPGTSPIRVTDYGQVAGRATGGVFNKEHIARFAEGNKMEAILPVENEAAMAKVRRAIFGGEPLEMFAKKSTNESNNSNPTVYVHTLIADERGLKELERKMNIIRLKEAGRRG